MRVLLVHCPRRQGTAQDTRYSIMAVPQGMFALAALLQDAGHEVVVAHLGLERLVDPEFALADLLAQQKPQIVALALHWHHQTREVLEAAREVRGADGDPFIVLGGLTASLVHRQLMERWPEVDGVIRGDAEAPLLGLAQRLGQGLGDLADVPNLTWRRGGEAVVNPMTYLASQAEIHRLCYTRLELMRHHQYYSGLMTHDPAQGSLSAHTVARRFNLPISRGCSRDCPRCGGARQAQARHTGRWEPLFQDPGKVVDMMREMVEQGCSLFYVSCHPADHDPGYYPRLFHRVREAGIRCAMQIEAFAYLPDQPYLEAFAGAFDLGRSLLILSPHGGPDRRRRVGVHYADRELFVCLERASALGINTRCHMGLGPPDGWSDVIRAGRLAMELRARHGSDTVALLDEVDPGSPWTAETDGPTAGDPRPRLSRILSANRRGQDTPPGYHLEQAEEKLLALQAACHRPGAALSRLRSGLPRPPPGQGVALVPLGAFGRIDAALDHASSWTVLVSGCTTMEQIQQAALGARRLLPGTAAVRALDREPVFPAAPLSPPGAAPLELLTDGCRWGSAPCPAPRLDRLLLSGDGAIRCCHAAPPSDPGELLLAMGRRLGQQLAEERRLRGCGSCPAAQSCPCCIYLGGLEVDAYCRHTRGARP